MSCFILHPDSIRKIGYTLAAILNADHFGNTYSFDVSAVRAAKLPQIFRDTFRPAYGFDPERISEALHKLNAKAYAGRYSDPEAEPFAPPTKGTRYQLRPVAGACGTAQEWHYHLASLLDCYLYQTAEDTTLHDPMREALDAFAAHLASGIVQHSEQYAKFRWGE